MQPASLPRRVSLPKLKTPRAALPSQPAQQLPSASASAAATPKHRLAAASRPVSTQESHWEPAPVLQNGAHSQASGLPSLQATMGWRRHQHTSFDTLYCLALHSDCSSLSLRAALQGCERQHLSQAVPIHAPAQHSGSDDGHLSVHSNPFEAAEDRWAPDTGHVPSWQVGHIRLEHPRLQQNGSAADLAESPQLGAAMR